MPSDSIIGGTPRSIIEKKNFSIAFLVIKLKTHLINDFLLHFSVTSFVNNVKRVGPGIPAFIAWCYYPGLKIYRHSKFDYTAKRNANRENGIFP